MLKQHGVELIPGSLGVREVARGAMFFSLMGNKILTRTSDLGQAASRAILTIQRNRHSGRPGADASMWKPDLSVTGFFRGVYALGDFANVADSDGKAVATARRRRAAGPANIAPMPFAAEMERQNTRTLSIF